MKQISVILACLALASTAVYAEVPDEVKKEFERQKEIEEYKCQQAGGRGARYTGGSYGNSSNQELRGNQETSTTSGAVGIKTGVEFSVQSAGQQKNESREKNTQSNWECY